MCGFKKLRVGHFRLPYQLNLQAGPCYFSLFQAQPMCTTISVSLQFIASFISLPLKCKHIPFVPLTVSLAMTISKLVYALRPWEEKRKVHKLSKKGKNMEHYLNWAQALASVWGFMLLVGLMCCCLSIKPRQQGDTSSGNGSCTCDGGYAGVWCMISFQIKKHWFLRFFSFFLYTFCLGLCLVLFAV